MQDNKTHHKKGDKIVRPHVPGWGDDERRIHRIRRRIRQTPLWLRVLTVVVLLATAFVGGWSWSGGRSAVLAERLEEAEIRVEQLVGDNVSLTTERDTLVVLRDQLQTELDWISSKLMRSAPLAELQDLEDQYNFISDQLMAVEDDLLVAERELVELKPQLSRANDRVRQLEEIVVPSLERQVDAQRNRYNRLQDTLTAQRLALPGQIATQLNTSPPIELAGYRIAVSQEILRESFGIRFGSINDETLAVTVGGTAVFGLSEHAVATGNEISIGLPKLIVAGLTGFTPDSYDYQAGFLARVGDQDVSDLMVWVETNQLQPKACADVTSLRGLISQTEQHVQVAAGEQEVEVVWVDSTGREFESSQLTNPVLLDAAC